MTNPHITQPATFLEYILGGCEINVHIAIDFTGSNGNPKDRSSLHYVGDNFNNQYTDAIRSVLNILKYYDSDQLFPTYGFGAKIPGKDKPSHCFALNGDIFDPEIHGIDGVMKAYENVLKKSKLYGPTNFADIIKQINGYCKHSELEISQNNQMYQILLILTDGAITDIEETVDEIVAGSALPLSIIIVGVGNDNFDKMDRLDGDDEPLYSKKLNKTWERDIVQFVPYKDYKDGVRLAQKVLEEVPGQLTEYFISKGIKPNPRKHANEKELREEQEKKAQEESENLDYYMT